MIQEFYGLEKAAFSLGPDLDFLYLSEAHEEAIAHLVYGLEQEENVILIVGDIGTGKTLALHRLIDQVSSIFVTVAVSVTALDFEQLVRLVLLKLDSPAPPQADFALLLHQFEKELLEIRSRGKKLLLVIDESQNLAVEVLEGVRMLLNLAQPGGQALQLVLAGQLGLRDTMRCQELRQFAQRIRVDYEFGPLNRKELDGYIAHRLKAAGRTDPLFDAAALDLVYLYSRGVPRLVNVLAEKAMLAGYVDGAKRIGRKYVEDLGKEIIEEPPPRKPAAETRPPAPEPRPKAREPQPQSQAPEPRKEPPPPEVEAPRETVVAESEPAPEPRPVRVEADPVEFAARATPEKRRSSVPYLLLAIALVVVATIAIMTYPRWRPVLDGDSAARKVVSNTPDPASPAVEIPAETTEREPAEPVMQEPAADPLESPLPVAQPELADPDVTGPVYVVHVASFIERGRADNLSRRLAGRGLDLFVETHEGRGDRLWNRVYLGPYSSREDAVELAARLAGEGAITYSRILER